MTKTILQRLRVTKDDNFVVFLIGMHFKNLWKLHTWVPSVFILPKILNELTYIRESGFLGYQMISYFPPVIAKYWKSVKLLEFHTKNRDENKYPAWNRFTQKINRDIQVEIWHEIFQVNEGQFTRVYNGLPVYGTTRMIQIIPFMAIREKAI